MGLDDGGKGGGVSGNGERLTKTESGFNPKYT